MQDVITRTGIWPVHCDYFNTRILVKIAMDFLMIKTG